MSLPFFLRTYLYIDLSFASSTFEGQGARSGGQEECSVRLFAIFVCMSKVSSCSLLLAPCSLTQLAKVEYIDFRSKPDK